MGLQTDSFAPAKARFSIRGIGLFAAHRLLNRPGALIALGGEVVLRPPASVVAANQTEYQNDFETAVGTGWTFSAGSLLQATTPNGRHFLGRHPSLGLDAGTLTFTMAGRSPHQGLEIAFDLYVIAAPTLPPSASPTRTPTPTEVLTATPSPTPTDTVQVHEGEAFREGSVGWGAAQPEISLPDGPKLGPRWSAVFHHENGEWKMVQVHASVGLTNEQLFGVEFPS